MSAVIIPFPVERGDSTPTFAERVAARRAYRAGMRLLASSAVASAFTQSAKIAGSQGIGLDDAVPIFVAAMRRELRRSGQF